MKKLALALALLFALPAAGQSVGASQIKKKTNGGLSADSANALAVSVYRGTSAPASPVTGQLWCDTTAAPCSMKTYNGATWELPSDGAAVTQADISSLPANPTDGMIVYVRSLKRAIIYDATDAKWYYVGQQGIEAKPDYTMEVTGSPLTPPSASGSVAAGGSVTLGTHVCAVSVYNSTGGETIPGAATSTLTATSGQQTLALTFTASGTGWRGKRIYCSKADTASPLFYVDTVDDTTTGTYNVTIADASFWHVAPDFDFSYSLPSGWIGHTPTIGNGGCGATATGVVCFDRSPTAPNPGVSGPRAVYSLGATPSDNWTAEWTVDLFTNGFAGGVASAQYTSAMPAVAFADATSANTVAMGIYFTQRMPLGIAATDGLRFGRSFRTSTGAWTQSGAQPGSPTPPVSSATASWFVRLARRKTIDGDTYRVAFSSDGIIWSTPQIGDNINPCTAVTSGEWCLSVPMTSVGISAERGTSGAGMILIRITDFTWRAD